MKTFAEIELPEELRKNLENMKFEKPTPVQAASIPEALLGRDLMVSAETGSGKTAAYGIPIVTKLLEDPKKRGLILAPTRELAQQIADFLKVLLGRNSKIQVATLVGGADMRRQFKALQKKPRLVVATPGRLNDHLRRNTLQLHTTEFLVLDEGDRMLDMGFAPQLDEILKFLPKKRQTFLFTATLPAKVQKMAEAYLYQPKNIKVGEGSVPVKAIQQSVIQVPSAAAKNEKLIDELNEREGSVIVFLKTKTRTDSLARFLKDYGFSADLIHGGRSQGQRNMAIKRFKQGEIRILCATDVAARGIDVPQVEHVINFDLPMMDEDYVHRIGRTARNGAKGEATSFVTPGDVRAWKQLVRKYQIPNVELKEMPRGQRGGRKSDRPYRDRERPQERGASSQRRDEGRGTGRRRPEAEERSFERPQRGRKKPSAESYNDFPVFRGQNFESQGPGRDEDSGPRRKTSPFKKPFGKGAAGRGNAKRVSFGARKRQGFEDEKFSDRREGGFKRSSKRSFPEDRASDSPRRPSSEDSPKRSYKSSGGPGSKKKFGSFSKKSGGKRPNSSQGKSPFKPSGSRKKSSASGGAKSSRR